MPINEGITIAICFSLIQQDLSSILKQRKPQHTPKNFLIEKAINLSLD